MKVPFYEPDLSPLESEYVTEAMQSGWVGSKGDFIDEFEVAFAKYIGVKYAVTCSNGTSALFLAYLACGMTNDSKVIAPYYTFAATYNMANCISKQVKLIKGDSATWNLAPQQVDDCDIFVSVHLYGNPCDMGQLWKSTYAFIEDCAQSLGSEFKGKKVGSFGKASCFSFHSAKTITTGEGGMVCTNDKDVADKVRHLKNHSMTEPYKHDQLGWNFRMTNMQAAMGLAQLERIGEILDKKKNVTKRYDTHLHKNFIRQMPTRSSTIHKWANAYQHPLAEKIRIALKEQDIETRPGFNREDVIVFPSASTLTVDQQDRVIEEANLYA